MVFSEQQGKLNLASSDATVMTSNKSTRTGTTRPLEDFPGTLSLPSVWRTYQSFVRKHHMKLELADGAIHRLLFWLPHHDNSGDGPPWREVMYGLLSVNQLAMHCSQQPSSMDNSYGFSVRTRSEPAIPATSIRIALNVIHCLMPSLLELVAARKGSDDDTTNNNDTTPGTANNNNARSMRRQAQLRLRLEQLKCVLRLYLLYSYWNQVTQESSSSPSSPGIMLDGGMYQPMDDPLGMSEEEVQSDRRRRSYRGRRTGLLVSKDGLSDNPSRSTIPAPQSQSSAMRQVLLGELLYSLRPVWWAASEARHAAAAPHDHRSPSLTSDPLFKSWIVTLGMELLSLGLLSGERRNGNPFSKEEWNRRRMKLLLYLLRAPVWNRVTSPTLERTCALARKVPVLGGLVDSYIWDWILYWKHPYVSEEG
jgi:hypothetical protein